jgi:hypothetical protein
MTQCLDHLSDKELKAAVRSLKGRKKAVAREALHRRHQNSRQDWLRRHTLIAAILAAVIAASGILIRRRRAVE